MEKGKLIVVEGACDGIGKTTQYEMLSKHLTQDGNNIVSHHFPSYGTYQGLPVEKCLKGEYGNINELSPYFINSLYANDRGITWYTYLKNYMNKEKQYYLIDILLQVLFINQHLLKILMKRKNSLIML